MSVVVEVLICEMRMRNPIGGPKRIAYELAKRNIGLMPSQSGIYLEDGRELKCLTGVDDHSRFCVSAGLMHRANSKSLCDHFLKSLGRYGIPQEILTDNGKVFTGHFGYRDTEMLFDKICRENGIEHLFTTPRSPATTGKIERFHHGPRTEFVIERKFENFDHGQSELDGFIDHYNYQRPH